ncbi:ATP-binding cassette domain-containing protein [Paenibacillus filicis]|uniref:ATP-binding cassette domain-containing protein n=1 Tax=Paenibacillus filicis TaxID=669464 RepID=A0ABU9DML3_9BACL
MTNSGIPPFLSLQQATVHFSTGTGTGTSRQALNGITLDIRQGEFVALVGPNGSGKSTLASVMLGLCPLSRGNCMLQEGALLRGVLQQPDTQVLGDTIEEELALTRAHLGESAEQLESLREAALRKVGLRLPADTPFSALSGGQRQLVNLALALSLRPSGLLLDEATAMLDPHIREQVLAVVATAHREGMTVIWITHRMEEAAAADRIIALEAGKIAFDGTPEAFFYGSGVESTQLVTVPAAGSSAAVQSRGTSEDADGSGANSPDPQSACERLALELPFVVQTVRALRRRGLSVSGRPLFPEQLAVSLRASVPAGTGGASR